MPYAKENNKIPLAIRVIMMFALLDTIPRGYKCVVERNRVSCEILKLIEDL